jgi:hypothetical protein
MTKKILLCLGCLTVLLFTFESAGAYEVGGTPVVLTSSGGEGTHTLDALKPYTDQVILQNITYNTDTPMSYSASGTGYSQYSTADPLGFQVTTAIAASLGANWATTDGVATWFTVNGPSPGAPVTLQCAIAFQGQISASGPNSGAYFTNYLSFVDSPTSNQYHYLIVQNGAVTNPNIPVAESLAGTVPDLFFAAPGTHDINEVIRSKVFTVYSGTPFRLALVLGATVSTNGNMADTASVDWDPGFSTMFSPDGFTLGDGSPLSSAGLSVQAVNVPLPASILLLGSGLAALVGFRRKFQKN